MGIVRAEAGIDRGAIVHCGNPLVEQRLLDQRRGWADLSHRGVLTLSGPDRLGWLHAISTQQVSDLHPGQSAATYLLDPNGRIRFWLGLVDDGETLWAHTEPGMVGELVAYLDSMRFMSRVEVADRTADVALVRVMGEWFTDSLIGSDTGVGSGAPASVTDDAGDGSEPARGDDLPTPLAMRRLADTLGGTDVFIERAALPALGGRPDQVGLWALEARRISAGIARVGVDTDERTIPNEVAMPVAPEKSGERPHLLGSAVHLEKGCYTGQETVARVWNMGRPPRRLVRLHLDGSLDEMPAVGDEVALRDPSTGAPGKVVGVMGSSAHHFEDGPIGLALVKRNVPVDAALVIGEIAAAQEVVVEPEVGLHVRPERPA